MKWLLEFKSKKDRLKAMKYLEPSGCTFITADRDKLISVESETDLSELFKKLIADGVVKVYPDSKMSAI